MVVARTVQTNEEIVIRLLCCLLSRDKTKTIHKDLYFGLHCATVILVPVSYTHLTLPPSDLV